MFAFSNIKKKFILKSEILFLFFFTQLLFLKEFKNDKKLFIKLTHMHIKNE